MADFGGNEIRIVLRADDQATSKLNNVSSRIRRFGTDTRKEFDRFMGGINGYNSLMSGFNSAVDRSMRIATRAVVNFVDTSISKFIEFSQQHATVMGILKQNYPDTPEGERQLQDDSGRLKQQAIDLGMSGPDKKGSLSSTLDYAGAQQALAQAGVSAQDMLNTNMVSQIAKFSSAAGMDMQSAADFAVNLGTQFKIPTSEYGPMLDKVVRAADISTISVENIVASMQHAGPAASAFNRPIEEVLAAISTLGMAGLRGGKAGTGINALYTRGMNPTGITATSRPPTKEAEDAYFAIASQIVDAEGNFNGLADIGVILDEFTSTMSDQEKSWIGSKMFSMFQQKAAYAMGVQTVDENGQPVYIAQQMQDTIETSSTGAVDARWEELLNSSFGAYTKVMNAFDATQIDFGDRLSPLYDEVMAQIFNALATANFDWDLTALQTAIDTAAANIAEKFGTKAGELTDTIANNLLGIIVGLEANTPMVGGTIELTGGILGGIGNLFSNLFSGEFQLSDIPESWTMITDGFTAFGDAISQVNTNIEGLPDDLKGFAEGIRNAIVVLLTLTGITKAARFVGTLGNLAHVFGWGSGGKAGAAGAKAISTVANMTITTATNVTINTATNVNFGAINTPTMNVTAGVVNINGMPNTGGPNTSGLPNTPQISLPPVVSTPLLGAGGAAGAVPLLGAGGAGAGAVPLLGAGGAGAGSVAAAGAGGAAAGAGAILGALAFPLLALGGMQMIIDYENSQDPTGAFRRDTYNAYGRNKYTQEDYEKFGNMFTAEKQQALRDEIQSMRDAGGLFTTEWMQKTFVDNMGNALSSLEIEKVLNALYRDFDTTFLGSDEALGYNNDPGSLLSNERDIVSWLLNSSLTPRTSTDAWMPATGEQILTDDNIQRIRNGFNEWDKNPDMFGGTTEQFISGLLRTGEDGMITDLWKGNYAVGPGQSQAAAENIFSKAFGDGFTENFDPWFGGIFSGVFNDSALIAAIRKSLEAEPKATLTSNDIAINKESSGYPKRPVPTVGPTIQKQTGTQASNSEISNASDNLNSAAGKIQQAVQLSGESSKLDTTNSTLGGISSQIGALNSDTYVTVNNARPAVSVNVNVKVDPQGNVTKETTQSIRNVSQKMYKESKRYGR